MSASVTYKDYSKKIVDAVKAGIPGALEVAAVNITSKAKDLAPVDTGNLRNSISYRPGDKSNEMIVGANAPYAVYQEYGTRYMKPQPFMRPAIDLVIKGTGTMQSIKKIVNEHFKKYPELEAKYK
jgi:HK97 gp10 family phage protein